MKRAPARVQTLASRRGLHGAHPTRDLSKESCEKSGYHRSMNGFGAIKRLARVGFLVKGVLYMVIGALALQVAAKAGGEESGSVSGGGSFAGGWGPRFSPPNFGTSHSGPRLRRSRLHPRVVNAARVAPHHATPTI